MKTVICKVSFVIRSKIIYFQKGLLYELQEEGGRRGYTFSILHPSGTKILPYFLRRENL